MDISIVVPVWNEEENIRPLYSRLGPVLKKLKLKYEVVFVDDGSQDTTPEIVNKICHADKNVKLIRFRRNFGQTAAMKAGIDNSTGDIIVFMDGDLQNDPADIPALLKEMNRGYDVVSGWRRDRKDPLSKKIPSKISNKLACRITGLKLHDFGCTLKAYKRETLAGLSIHGEMHRYLPALAAWEGFRVSEISVAHYPRALGESKYGYSRLVKGLMDLINMKLMKKYYNRPNHLFGGLGIISFVTGFIIGLYLAGIKLIYGASVSDRPLLLLAVLLLVMGAQFISLGFLGSMIVKAHYETPGVKPYVIWKKINL